MFPLSLPKEQVQSEVFTHVEGSPHVTQSDHARPGDFPSSSHAPNFQWLEASFPRPSPHIVQILDFPTIQQLLWKAKVSGVTT